MLTPAPTSKIDPRLARGILVRLEEAVPVPPKPEMVVITFPNTSYETHLVKVGPISAQVGKRIIGIIRAKARRIDEVTTGGRYIEPVYGRPRRVQGTVVAIEPDAVVVNAGMPIHCTPTDPRQRPGDFKPGQFVSFDVLEGATFEERH